MPGAAEPTPPRVSVLMPVYDAEAYIARALESILKQSFSDFELLVLDDGSRDRSLEIVKETCGNDPRVRLFRRSHAGLTVRLCEGVDAAQGEFLARQDADDISRPERFERQVQFMDAHPEASVVGAGSLIIDPEGWPIRERFTPLDHDEIEAWLLQGRGDAIFHSAAFFRRERVIQAGGYCPEAEPAEDVDLYLRLAERGRLANLPFTLLESRQHASRVSSRRAGEQRQKINAVLADAYLRRGLENAKAQLPAIGESLSPAECQRRWARDATEGGNRATARKHAWAAFRAEPLHPRSWHVLIRALLGLRLEPLRRSLPSSDARRALKRSARGWIRDNLPLLGLSRALVRRSGLRRRLYWRANAYPGRERTLLKRAARRAGEAFADRCIEEMNVLDRLNVRAMNVDGYLDVGANIGQNTYSARVWFPERVPVYAFEPSKPCFERLTTWCGDLPNVHCFPVGVGAESGTATFHRSLSSPTSQASAFLPFSEAYKQEFEWARAPTVEESVEVVALDDFFASRNIDPAENLMLHIDVEGFDYQVLQGARRKILPRTRALIIEVTYGLFEGQGSFEEIFDLLRGDFEFRGFLDPLVTGSAGQSLYQDAFFVRRA